MNLKQLAAPFAAKDIFWRVGQRSDDGKLGRALPYISARAVQDRLDEVVGPDKWRSSFQDIVTGNRHVAARCTIGIHVNNMWVDKEDGAQVDANLGNNAELAVKGAYTDAFKRAAVMWGIGRYLYAFQAPWVELDEHGRMVEAPSLPAELLPEGDTTRSTVIVNDPPVTAAAAPVAQAPVEPEGGESTDAASASAPAPATVAEAPAVAAEAPQERHAVASPAPAPVAEAPAPAPAAAPVAAPAPAPAAAAPAPAAEAPAGEHQPYTEAELEALPERERQYVRSITSHLAKRTSLQNLRAYVNGPKMLQNLSEGTRKRLTSLIDAAIGQQEMSTQA